MRSRIESWAGVEAYFTFADQLSMMMIFLVAAIAATAGAIVSAVRHERERYAKLRFE